MQRITLYPILLTLLASCGSGGGDQGQPQPPVLQIAVVNCLPGRTAVNLAGDLADLSDPLNDLGSIDDDLNTPEGWAEFLDQVKVDALFASATVPAELDLGVSITPPGHPDGDLVLDQVNWSPGDGSLYLKLIPNPGPGHEPYVVQPLTEAEFQQMLMDGSIQGVVGG